MQLNEMMVTKGRIIESNKDKLPRGVLCRVSYNICNVGRLNQNGRIYEHTVWDRVMSDKELQEKMTQRKLFGHSEHPTSTSSDLQLTSHVITKMWEDKQNSCIMQEIDVLDTPCGRIVNTLLEADCAVGVSTRAEGDLEEKVGDDGKKFMRVIPESYRYVTTDFTADPSTYGTKPMNVVREIKSELVSGKLTNEEKVFATTLLEAIEKVPAKESKIPDDKDSDQTKIDKLTEASVIDRWKAYMKERWPEKPENDSYAKEWLERFKKGEEWNRADYEGRAVLKKLYPENYPDDKDEIMKGTFESKKEPEYREGTIEEFVKKELVKMGALAECMGIKCKVSQIKEHTVSVTFDNGGSATVTGPTPVSIAPDGMVVIPNLGAAASALGTPEAPADGTCPACEEMPEGGLSDELTPAEEGEAIEKEEDLQDALEDDVITPEEHEAMETPEEEAAEHAPGGYEEGMEEVEGEVEPEAGETESEEEPEMEEEEATEEPEEDEEEEELEESKGTKALYTKKGLTPPKGKGIHKKKFHEMATAIAAGQKKKGKSEKDAKKSGYAIAMSKLGKKGAVKAGHRRDESKINEKGNPYDVYLNGKCIDTVYDDSNDTNDVKKSLVNHDGYDPNIVVRSIPKDIAASSPATGKKKNESKLVFESYEDMVDYLREKFSTMSTEEVTQLASVFPAEKLNESKTTNSSYRELVIKEASSRAEAEKAMELLAECDTQLKTLQESVRVESKILTDKLKEAKTQESGEVSALRKILESTIASARKIDKELSETKAKLQESKTVYENKVKELERAGQTKLIKEYVNLKSKNSSLALPSNSRALLESCTTIKEVDKVFEDVRDALRREALLPSKVDDISISITEKKDPVQDRISESIGSIFNSMV